MMDGAATETEARPFRGVDPKELGEEELLEQHTRLNRAVAEKRQEVDRLKRELPVREAAGEPAMERLDEARGELERLEAVRRAWRGPVRAAKQRREGRCREQTVRRARAKLPGALDAFIEARGQLQDARRGLRNTLSALHRHLRDEDLRSAVKPLPRGTAEKLRAAARVDGSATAGVDLDLLPVEGEEEGAEETRRRVVERGRGELLLVPAAAWSEEELRAKRAEHPEREVRRATAAEVTAPRRTRRRAPPLPVGRSGSPRTSPGR